ncbi:hypothetical protein [Actinoplanes sp. L3-i22]|uniref:hypothetical protein n=1 Tax=Actinoplanes sp. L3-i22 TaxID=2836373 RepID=UPI001C86589B|nr:hypothetical protein [Actinoplanes sp. L3-i22]
MAHYLAPAHLSGADDPALGLVDTESATALRIVLAGWLDEVVATPDGASGDPHDPRVSVPDLVEEVRQRHGLGPLAAAYYLQVLALPDPGDKNVREWLDLDLPGLRAAQRTLTGAGLVVSAKRERAGRAVFLPGGWRAARAPHLPVETWKLPMYAEAGKTLLVPLPVPGLFRAAWARAEAGDRPRYLDAEGPR